MTYRPARLPYTPFKLLDERSSYSGTTGIRVSTDGVEGIRPRYGRDGVTREKPEKTLRNPIPEVHMPDDRRVPDQAEDYGWHQNSIERRGVGLRRTHHVPDKTAIYFRDDSYALRMFDEPPEVARRIAPAETGSQGSGKGSFMNLGD